MNSPLARIFGLWAGPAAWFLQLCVGYALASWPCFPQDIRQPAPLAGYDWTNSALLAVSAASFVVALAACFVSRQIYRATHDVADAQPALVATGMERTCFLALWGMVFAAGSAVAIAATALSLLLLPRCAG